MKVLFRVDASSQIGFGHVMRCLTLADALRRRGAECRFVARSHPGHLHALIAERGYAVHALPLEAGGTAELAPDAWLGASWSQDAEQTLACLEGAVVDWLIVDHYALDQRWEAAVRPACRRLLVIDDLADRPHDCDLLLDQNLVADWDSRYQGLLPASCPTLLGPRYALLSPRFAEWHERVPPREGAVQRVLVYFGGADNANLTGMAVSAFQSLQRQDVQLEVVINPSSQHAPALRAQVQGWPQIHLHERLPSLAPLMVQADLALGAGGVTSWERCCLGLPALVVVLAENQRPIALELARQGAVRYQGDWTTVSETVLASALRQALAEPLPAEWSVRCRQLVDGQGVQRVSAALALGLDTPLRARPACLSDESLLLEWANDPLVRRQAFNPERIDPLTHRRWFRQKLREVADCQFFVVTTAEGLPLGPVRFQRQDACWEIHYALAPVARGRGLAAPVLAAAIQACQTGLEDGGVLHLLGRVKVDNRASQRVFETLGFTAAPMVDGVLEYRLQLDAPSAEARGNGV